MATLDQPTEMKNCSRNWEDCFQEAGCVPTGDLDFALYIYIYVYIYTHAGLWEMTTCVIQQKGLPTDQPPYKGGDSLVSQKWLDKPRVTVSQTTGLRLVGSNKQTYNVLLSSC